MTDKSKKAFEDFYFKALHFQSSRYKIQDMNVRTMKEIFDNEKDRDAAEKAVMGALEPFYKGREREIYEAAKKFVETYEANDLA